MALEIAQIGPYPFRGYASSTSDLLFDTSRKWRTPSDQLTQVPGIVSYGRTGQPLADAESWTIRGSLICGQGSGSDGCETTWAEFNRLFSLAGGPFHLIGVRGAEECYCSHCGRCNNTACTHCNPKPYAQWMYILVEAESMSRKFEHQHSQSFPYDHIDIEMKVRPVIPYWEPIDDIRWRYWHTNKPRVQWVKQNTYLTPTVFHHPVRVPRPIPPQGGWSWIDIRELNSLSLLANPDNWELAYENSYADMFKRAETSNFLFINPITYQIYSDPYLWSAPPKSLYSLEGLFDTGTVTITVVGTAPSGFKVTNTASLNMAAVALQTVDAGHGGLLPGDYILAGEVEVGGGYMIRNQQVLDMYLPWEYDGPYPGYCYPGYNEISVSGDGLNFWRYLHIFRGH